VLLHHEYLTRQLIAYIGSKRRLLPLIHRAIASVCGDDGRGLDFLDLFAGSGVVSRLAKLMGFRVISNDWEEYAFLINTAHVGCDAGDAERLFGAGSSLPGLIEGLNRLAGPAPEEEYVARYYAPRSDDLEAADYRRERLFYTRSNALAIDRVRSEIDRLYPPEPASPEQTARRALLIAPLLYEASTHSNTSGVFKACHKGFGGHGRDALGRILAPVSLEPPILVDSAARATVLAEDANRLARSPVLGGRPVDIAYLDPPYAQHQYGSNYHLLTSIARWDRLPAPLDLDERGSLRSKAGIRPDWNATRSAYCSRRTAEGALADLVDALRARFILVSYSSDGIIGYERLLDILRSRGSLSVFVDEYTRYPGGRQSSTRLHRNVELVVVVDTSSAALPGRHPSPELLMERKRAELLLGRRFVRSRLLARLAPVPGSARLRAMVGGVDAEIECRDDGSLRLEPPPEELGSRALAGLRDLLEACVCADAEEELAELALGAREGRFRSSEAGRALLGTLRRLAHKKDRRSFEHWLEEVRSLLRDLPGTFGSLAPELDRLAEIAERRRRG
jgi:adenine-specific DNA-methyltransferase